MIKPPIGSRIRYTGRGSMPVTKDITLHPGDEGTVTRKLGTLVYVDIGRGVILTGTCKIWEYVR